VDLLADFLGTPASKPQPKPTPAAAAAPTTAAAGATNDWNFDAFNSFQPAAQPAAPVTQRQPAPSADEIDFSVFDAPKAKPQPVQPQAVRPQAGQSFPIPDREPSFQQAGFSDNEHDHDDHEMNDDDADAHDYHDSPPQKHSAPPQSRSREELPNTSAQPRSSQPPRRQPEERDVPVSTARRDNDDGGYGFAYGDPASSKEDPNSAGGFGFGFGNKSALLGKVMGGVSKVGERATKLTNAAVKVASEKSSQVKQFVNQTLLEEPGSSGGSGGGGSRVRKVIIADPNQHFANVP